ncbi:(-)-isopiperitenol/(-)-carveol dehydrogenase, mitochondrial-like [Prunus avium]|uniref:(-)-isopiperitenol/(-)-carveol dehydrogenase, mitochondrial-like n=1 Tax=Prunus avium TaxID=42229 RepID=A0A6P5S4I0_PRUAV|nr:(-)-isopiperitenol/(-)-carveol dehydrogenase, mitochondrial-like [Prunus avium]
MSSAATTTFSTKMEDPTLDAVAQVTHKKLQGKVAIVTGGASGIGEATARKFALHGARAVVIADVQDDKGQNVAASIGGPDRSTYIHCDVTDEEQVKCLVESTVRIYGSLDIMFSNAGIGSASQQTVLDFDLASYDKLMAVNVRGMVACVKHAARAMVEGRVRGSIVCTASISASMGGSIFTDYTMSKHAVLGLVRSASVQLGAYGVRVNSVSPGPVATPLLCELFKVEAEELGKMLESQMGLKVPVAGKLMSVESVADSVVFLASDEAEFVTGHNLVVDGGFKT